MVFRYSIRVKKGDLGEFPGGPVVKTPCFHCHGLRFKPIKELRSHKLHSTAIKKKKKKKTGERDRREVGGRFKREGTYV